MPIYHPFYTIDFERLIQQMQQIGLAFISAQVPTPFNLDHSVVFQHAKSSNSLRRVFKEVPIIESRSASFLTWFENPTKGVCGASAAAKKTLLVEDVHEFPGHVACDDASNSELVVPVIYQVCFIIYKRMIFHFCISGRGDRCPGHGQSSEKRIFWNRQKILWANCENSREEHKLRKD